MDNDPILRFLERDPLRCVAAREIYRRQDAHTLAFTGRALLMHAGSLHALSADSVEDALAACEGLSDAGLLCCDCMAAMPALMARYGLTWSGICYNVVYQGSAPVPVGEGAVLAPIPPEGIETVVASYGLLSPGDVRRHIQDGTLLGGYMQGEWVGFIGLHDEGSMGMLHIFPAYRRRGLGYTLEGLLINRLLKENRTPWAQIFTDNHASLSLQSKLGMARSDETVCWLSKQ